MTLRGAPTELLKRGVDASMPRRSLAVSLLLTLTVGGLATPAAFARAPQDPPQDPAAPEAGAPQDPAGGDPSSTSSPTPFIRGQWRTRYWARWLGNGSGDDHDLFSTLSVDVGDAARHDFTAHAMGRVTYDLDGRDGTFANINDSYGRSLDGLLYEAWVDVHRVDGLSLLRVGRQQLWDAPVFLLFDGGHAASEEMGDLKLKVGGFVGATTHLYEASQTGDLAAGGYAQIRPWQGGRLRADYMHLEDRARFRSHRDGLFGAAFWQRVGKELQFETRYTRIGSEDRDANVRATWTRAEWGLFVQARYYNLLQTQGDLVVELNPYFNSLNELRPYDQWTLLAGKDVGEMLQLQVAADLRNVRDDNDIGFYNRDFDHYYGTATLSDFGVDGLTVSVTADFWDSNAQLIRSWGADASYRVGKNTVSAGTYYSLYKYDLFTNSERDHVRTYYVRMRVPTGDSLTLDSDYEFEDNDLGEFHRFRLGFTWLF